MNVCMSTAKEALTWRMRPAAGSRSDGRDTSPAVSWFDAVLADIGDGQSLEQSLSTFSGHVRRLRNVLATVTRRSLVLLDEARGPCRCLAPRMLQTRHSLAAFPWIFRAAQLSILPLDDDASNIFAL